MRCEDVMCRDVKTIPVTWTVGECALLMREHNIGFVPVVGEDGRCVGVVTDRDIALRVVADGLRDDTLVADIMSTDLVACRPWHEVEKAEQMLGNARKSRLLVFDDDGKVIGVISLTDLMRHEDPERAARLFGQVTGREYRQH